ncbi:Nucleotide-binding alpha-beta plait domain containing protein [Trema orientale]|uniref:Nucleotide-binding alpha-beta plait domain containing protein n=1 Tax=Trema orientale TaxID=63057 RepID=A0A2P5FUE5_TREOI|nr:Nucleotide-binding alpha-beta plait domain containing protein [Trema orientale]
MDEAEENRDQNDNGTMENDNWSESVEDMVAAGDTDSAISLLESVISKLESHNPWQSDPQLASALTDLANLYYSEGFSLKADQLRSRASTIQQRLLRSSPPSVVSPGTLNKDLKEEEKQQGLSPHVAPSRNESSTYGNLEKSTNFQNEASPLNEPSDDDWEAIAERSPDELLSSQCLPGVSKLSLEDTKPKTPKRRGRGTFSYKKDELYSDNLSDKSVTDNLDDEGVSCSSERNSDVRQPTYGTRHILILADFPPSTRTIELEKLFEDFRDRGVVIRWVNDTTALAVFRTPSIALEARNHISCPFKVDILNEDDELINSISPKDLEPPRQRPKTSARTAQRLIAQGMGLKLPSTSFGSRELRKQEGDRRNRIVTRQKLKDDAWGSDD